MSWKKGAITREVCEESLKPYKNGKFCIRERPDSSDQWVLCVIYKDRPTHHLIKTGDDGILSINNKTYGNATTLESLVDTLNKPSVPGWPVQLIMPSEGDHRWLHGPISKSQSEELLTADGSPKNGRFLIRKRDATSEDLVLSLIFRDKPTQHLITRNDEGNLTVNKRAYGNFSAIGDLVAAISSDPIPKGWPVKLIEGIDKSGEVFSLSGEGKSSISKKAAGSTKKKKVSKSSSSSSVGKSGQPWLHEKMTNGAASELLSSKTEDGSFIIRVHDASQHQYVISVIYRGKPTHHLCVAPPSSVSTINKKPTGATGLSDTIEIIKSKQPFWPVPLKSFVSNGSAAGGASSGDDDAGAAEAAAAKEEADRKAVEEKEKAEREAAAVAANEAAEKAEAEEKAKAEDKKAEGFKSLPNPYPEGPEVDGGENENGYMAVGPTANELLSQARMIAIAASSGLDPELKEKYGVGKLLNSNLMGASSTDDDYAAAGIGGNPYLGTPGISGTNAGVQKMASLESAVLEVDHRVNANRARIEGIEELMDTLAEGLTLKQEVTELRAKNVTLEKKLLMLEQFLLKGAAGDPDNEGAMTLIEVRLIHRSGAAGGVTMGRASGGAATGGKSLPSKSDLLNTSIVGKIAAMKGSTYGEMREMIHDQFDDSEVPRGYKFFSVDADEDDLLMIHEKQEFKVPVDAYVVYMCVTGGAKRAAY